MSTRVRSYAKINLGLAIGPVRQHDGYHGLVTMYQTLDLHDLVTVSAHPAAPSGTRLTLTSNHEGVPCDARNTAWRMAAGALDRMGIAAEVAIHIDKRLPVQGGMGAGSANAAAALIALERELGQHLPDAERLALAAEVGSDVPLFLIGGAVLGTGRGELVAPMPDLPATPCVVAVPAVGVSTPQAFRDWDAREAAARLTSQPARDSLDTLSRVYAAVFRETTESPADLKDLGLPSRIETKRSGNVCNSSSQAGIMAGCLAETALLSLAHAGIENDFEDVVFSRHPPLREIKRELMGVNSREPAWYAALSGSGSAVFGLYGSDASARAAQQRVQALGVRALMTETLPRALYWKRMFAE